MIPRGFDIVPTLSTCHQWFPCGPLLASHLTWFFPGLFLLRSRPWLLTTAARRWFGTCSCQPVPRGLPSSIKQLHTLGPPRPFALVAHDHRRVGPDHEAVAGTLPRARLRRVVRPAQATTKPETDSPANGRDGIA